MSELYPNFEKLLASVEQNILQYQLLQVESFQIVIKIPPKIYLQKFETQTAWEQMLSCKYNRKNFTFEL